LHEPPQKHFAPATCTRAGGRAHLPKPDLPARAYSSDELVLHSHEASGEVSVSRGADRRPTLATESEPRRWAVFHLPSTTVQPRSSPRRRYAARNGSAERRRVPGVN
jgi:uroporphyrinogen-III synthase